jgi:hypothetical protein
LIGREHRERADDDVAVLDVSRGRPCWGRAPPPCAPGSAEPVAEHVHRRSEQVGGRVVHLEAVTPLPRAEVDPSQRGLLDLDRGHGAERKDHRAPWTLGARVPLTFAGILV